MPKSFAAETRKKSYDGEPVEYRKLTQLAAEVIADFPLANVTVLFDAYLLIAHLLLTHLGASQPGAQAEQNTTKPLDLPSVPQLQALLRSRLWDDTIQSMEQGTRTRRIVKKPKQMVLLHS